VTKNVWVDGNLRVSNYQKPSVLVLDLLEQEENRVHDAVSQIRVLKNDSRSCIFTASQNDLA